MSALKLTWAYGVSPITHNVVNLSSSQSQRVFFASSNTAVIQDVRGDQQTILRGHTSSIACVCASSNKEKVATADHGSNSKLIVWNTMTAEALLTIPQPHPNGVLCMDISQDGTLLVTVSKPQEEGDAQEIALWDTSSSAAATRLISVPVPAGDPQICIRFSEADPHELVSNGRQRAFFWRACLPAAAAFQYYSPPLSSSDFKQKIGAFTVSTFVPGTTQALTGTEDGDVVVWDEQGMSAEVGTKARDRKAVKLMRLHGQAILWLSIIGDFIASGAADGYVRFFDPMLRLVAWFESMAAGPVCSVSFSTAPATVDTSQLHDLDLFLCPDFVVGTTRGAIIGQSAAAFNGSDPAERVGKRIVAGMLTNLAICCTHPLKSSVLVASSSGEMQVWDTMRHSLLKAVALSSGDPLSPTSACYARSGDFVAVGTSNGSILVLDGSSLAERVRFKQARTSIKAIAVSSTGRHIAAASADGFVLLIFLVPYKQTHRWEYVGRNKVHYSPVVAVHFGEAPSGDTRCFSLSADGRLAEFDLDKSCLEAGVVVCGTATTGMSSSATAMSFTPPLTYFQKGVIDTQLVLADDAFKVRVFNPDTSVTSLTYRGPIGAGPLCQMTMFQASSCSTALVAFRAREESAGIMLWPMDGHPAGMETVQAHAGKIIGMAVTHDGRCIMTASSSGHMNEWTVHGDVLERRAAAAATAPLRWESLVASEADIVEAKRLFIFGQVRAQGEESTVARVINGRLPLDHIPELMCALGFYPTQSDITDMIASLAHAAAVAGEPKPADVSLETFLSLLYNFKPVKGVRCRSLDFPQRHEPEHVGPSGNKLHDPVSVNSWVSSVWVLLEQIEKAFVALGAARPKNKLPAPRLVEAVTTLGEVMDMDELTEAMRLLTGKDVLTEALPSQLTPLSFATDILGFEAAA